MNMDARGPRRCRVLVVEDEPIIAMDIVDCLEMVGCDVVGPVAQLAQALELAREDNFDCAILDVNVRGGHTLVLAETLIDRGIPILLASGYGEWALPASLATQDRITKPYTSAQLESSIRRLCDQVVSEPETRAERATISDAAHR